MSCSHPATFFDYACSTWYPNLNEKLNKKIQIPLNTCIGFSLKLEKRHHIPRKEFESISWLPVYKRVHQRKNAIKFKFANGLVLVIWLKFMSTPLNAE